MPASFTATTDSEIRSLFRLEISGYLLNWGLFGALSIQVYNYHLGFPYDKASTKALVYGVYLVEIVQTGLETYQAFSFIALDGPKVLQISELAGPIICPVVAFASQIFYAHRIYILSPSKLISFVVAVIAFLQFVAGMIYGIVSMIGNPAVLFFLSIPSVCWSVLSALNDLIIAGYMVYFLRQRSNTTFKDTRVIVKRIVHLTVETGILTATFQLALIFGYLVFPYSWILIVILSKLYSNTILVILNSRLHGTSDGSNSDNIPRQGSSLWFTSPEETSMNGQTSEHGTSLAQFMVRNRRKSTEQGC